MKHLQEYIIENINQIFETTCTNKDYSKHDYKYPLLAIDILLDNGYLLLGTTGNDNDVISGKYLTDKEKEDLKILQQNISTSTPQDFNNIIKRTGKKWTNIFKGTLSGYTNGLSSKNKGNAFEEYFKDHYADYEDNIKKIIDYNELKNISLNGVLNQKHPLTFKKNSITCGNIQNYNIGKTITDITLETDKGPIYLSLKSGDTVTFVNAGIKTLFTKEFFDAEKLNGDGKLLLDMLCIDEDKFRNVFTSYKEKDKRKAKAEKDNVDILKNIQNNKIFENFIKSVIGYGFIMVHQIKGNDIEYINFLTEKDLNNFISDIKEAYVAYPKPGEAKRVDVFIKYDKIKFKINLRSKTGGIYPTHMMADYKFI